jgi:hypothetical protein
VTRLMQFLPYYWRGRALYLPALTRQSQSARRATAVITGVALVWCVYVARQTPTAFLVPLVILALGPVLYIRSWPIWDLLVWDSKQPWLATPSEQDANYEAACEAFLAVGLRQPEAVRAALAKSVDPSPWRRMVNLYYDGLADLMQGREPDTASLAVQRDRLDPGPRHDSADVMVALIAAGAANLSGGDWRAPLLACRKQLGLKLSLRRALWPMQFAFLLMSIGLLIVAAYVVLAA